MVAFDDGFLVGKRYVLMDRDAKFSQTFRAILRDAEVKAGAATAANSESQCAFGALLAEPSHDCLDRMIFFGEAMLRRALAAYEVYYHHERNHQGLHNRLIEAGEEVGRCTGVD